MIIHIHDCPRIAPYPRPLQASQFWPYEHFPDSGAQFVWNTAEPGMQLSFTWNEAMTDRLRQYPVRKIYEVIVYRPEDNCYLTMERIGICLEHGFLPIREIRYDLTGVADYRVPLVIPGATLCPNTSTQSGLGWPWMKHSFLLPRNIGYLQRYLIHSLAQEQYLPSQQPILPAIGVNPAVQFIQDIALVPDASETAQAMLRYLKIQSSKTFDKRPQYSTDYRDSRNQIHALCEFSDDLERLLIEGDFDQPLLDEWLSQGAIQEPVFSDVLGEVYPEGPIPFSAFRNIASQMLFDRSLPKPFVFFLDPIQISPEWVDIFNNLPFTDISITFSLYPSGVVKTDAEQTYLCLNRWAPYQGQKIQDTRNAIATITLFCQSILQTHQIPLDRAVPIRFEKTCLEEVCVTFDFVYDNNPTRYYANLNDITDALYGVARIDIEPVLL